MGSSWQYYTVEWIGRVWLPGIQVLNKIDAVALFYPAQTNEKVKGRWREDVKPQCTSIRYVALVYLFLFYSYIAVLWVCVSVTFHHTSPMSRIGVRKYLIYCSWDCVYICVWLDWLERESEKSSLLMYVRFALWTPSHSNFLWLGFLQLFLLNGVFTCFHYFPFSILFVFACDPFLLVFAVRTLLCLNLQAKLELLDIQILWIIRLLHKGNFVI